MLEGLVSIAYIVEKVYLILVSEKRNTETVYGGISPSLQMTIEQDLRISMNHAILTS